MVFCAATAVSPDAQTPITVGNYTAFSAVLPKPNIPPTFSLFFGIFEILKSSSNPKPGFFN
jgi:hypothetical protein